VEAVVSGWLSLVQFFTKVNSRKKVKLKDDEPFWSFIHVKP